jgi:hypothetical protein
MSALPNNIYQMTTGEKVDHGLRLIGPPTLQEAEEFAVTSAAARSDAAAKMEQFAVLETVAHQRFDPICEKTHQAWKEAVAQRKSVIEPLEQARKILGGKVAAFDLAEKKRAEEAQRALMLAEQERAEAEREASIEYLEQLGCAPEEVKALCEAPVVVAPVIAPRAVEKSAVSTRFVPKGRVTNLLAFVRHAAAEGNEHVASLLEVNEGALNKLVAATGGTMKLPGVEIYQAPVVVTRSKGGK